MQTNFDAERCANALFRATDGGLFFSSFFRARRAKSVRTAEQRAVDFEAHGQKKTKQMVSSMKFLRMAQDC